MVGARTSTSGHVRVPYDHSDPTQGTFTLAYELGAPFDPRKQTLLLVADAQQFWVRPGTVKKLQADLVGSDFNVVGVMPRSQSNAVVERVSAASPMDWAKAYRLLRSGQFVADIDAVRRHLLGDDRRVLLYGRSGGALLVHEYLATHCHRVERAFTQATVMPFVQAELGVQSDRFWEEIGPETRQHISRVLKAHPARRLAILRTFQRQNFFEADVGEARAALAARLFAGDWAYFEERREAYQVSAIESLIASPYGIAVRVRLYEFHQPVADLVPKAGIPAPDFENTRAIAMPLLEAYRAGRLPPPRMNLAALDSCATEVLLLAGVRDHTADIRVQLPLAAKYRNAQVVALDDDHVFSRLNDSGQYRNLVVAFLRHGLGSPALENVVARLRGR